MATPFGPPQTRLTRITWRPQLLQHRKDLIGVAVEDLRVVEDPDLDEARRAAAAGDADARRSRATAAARASERALDNDRFVGRA